MSTRSTRKTRATAGLVEKEPLIEKDKVVTIQNKSEETKSKQENRMDEGVMFTDKPYYVYDETAEKFGGPEHLMEDIARRRDSGIAVPTFRIKKCVPYYIIEGTENFDDHVYEKRHQKWEMEEKRRKRWDLQQMREREQYQKLQEQGKRRRTEKQQKHPVISSLVPQAQALHAVEVTDRLPVSVFGCPLPKMSKKEFSLPWPVNKKMDNNSVKKGKTPRKK